MTLSAGVSWTIRITLGPNTQVNTEILWPSLFFTRLWKHSKNVCMWVHATKFAEYKLWGSSGKSSHASKNNTCRLCEGLWLIHVTVCKTGIWIEVTRCAWKWSCVLLLVNMVKVGGLYMRLVWVVWDNWKHSSELSILIGLSIKQGRQLGDSGRVQHYRNPLVYFLPYSALFVHFPLAPHPVPQHLQLLFSQQWLLRKQGRRAEEGRSGGASKREKKEST